MISCFCVNNGIPLQSKVISLWLSLELNVNWRRRTKKSADWPISLTEMKNTAMRKCEDVIQNNVASHSFWIWTLSLERLPKALLFCAEGATKLTLNDNLLKHSASWFISNHTGTFNRKCYESLPLWDLSTFENVIIPLLTLPLSVWLWEPFRVLEDPGVTSLGNLAFSSALPSGFNALALLYNHPLCIFSLQWPL